MSAPHLAVEHRGPVAVLTLDRPAKRNALSAAMWAALPGVLAGLAADPDVRVLVVTGAGPSFCAGADIGDLLGGPDPADPMAAVRRDNLAAQAALREFPVPTIAMVRGHCIGGGVELAVACDLRFSDPTGVFGVTPARVGVVYTPGSTRALLDLVGPAATKQLLLSGELVDAAEALRWGLVDRVLPAAELEGEVLRLAGVLAARSALSQRATKEVVAALLAGRDGEAEAARWYRETIARGELAEGVAAFAARRPPRFPWRPDRAAPEDRVPGGVAPGMTTIGMIGAGQIGTALTRLLLDAGHDVVLANSRGPESLTELVSGLQDRASSRGTVKAATAQEAGQAGDVVVVTVPLKDVGDVPAGPLAGKVVLDTCNYYPDRDGRIPELEDESTTTSELVAGHLAGARVVKAFNHIFAADVTAQAGRTPHRRAIAIAGDDASAKTTAASLIEEIGFDVVDLGPLAEGWRVQRDTPGYTVDLDADGLRQAAARARRYRDMG